MQKREQYRHVFRDGMKGKACGTGLKEIRAGCTGKHKHPRKSGEEKPNEEKA